MNSLNIFKNLTIFLPLISLLLLETQCSTFPAISELINATLSRPTGTVITKLTIEDKKYIEELSSRLSDLNLKNDFKFSGPHLLRWIKYADYDLQRAEDLLRTHILWRKSNNIDRLVENYKNHPTVNGTYFPYFITGHSFENNPVFYVPMGRWQYSKLKTFEERRNMVKYGMSILENGIESTRGLTYEGSNVAQVVWILDFGGLDFKNFINIFYYLSPMFDPALINYPYIKRVEFIVRLPFGVRVLAGITLRLFNSFQKELRHAQIFDNISKRSMEAALMALIPPSAIPEDLGGNYKVPYNKI